MELSENEVRMVQAYRSAWTKLRKLEDADDLRIGIWLRKSMARSRGHRSLQVGVKDGTGRLSDDFVTLDLYDKSEVIDHNEDVMAMTPRSGASTVSPFGST